MPPKYPSREHPRRELDQNCGGRGALKGRGERAGDWRPRFILLRAKSGETGRKDRNESLALARRNVHRACTTGRSRAAPGSRNAQLPINQNGGGGTLTPRI